MTYKELANAYLRHTTEAGYGKALALSSWLTYTLRGRAKDYMSKYEDGVLRALSRKKDVVVGPSVRGAIAFYRRSVVPPEEQ